MKKKVLAMVLTVAASVSCLAAPVFAENTASAQTQFSLYIANDPTYTITIPEKITLSAAEKTPVTITASNVANIEDGKKVSVKVKKGSGSKGKLYLTGDQTNPNTNSAYTMTLCFTDSSGNRQFGAGVGFKKKEVASFTADGEQSFNIWPYSLECDEATQSSSNGNLTIQKGVHYTGYMDYTIEYVDAE